MVLKVARKVSVCIGCFFGLVNLVSSALVVNM